MVAQSQVSYHGPRPALEADPRKSLRQTEELELELTSIEQGAALEEEREGGVKGEESDNSDDGQIAEVCKNTNFNQKDEAHDSSASDLDDQEDRLVISDTGDEEYQEGEQEVDDPSSGISDDCQDGKLDRNPGWRKKSQKKMEYAKNWNVKNLVFERNGVCLVPLSDISSKYLADCKRDGQEPLLVSVLCRLLHQQFPEAGKCRLGPRGKQKIHYSKLRWQFKKTAEQCNKAAAPLTPAVDERAEKTPCEGSTSPQMQAESTQPQPIMGGRGVEQRGQTISDVLSATPSLPPVENDDEGQKECEEASARLQQVVKKVCSQGKRDMLLKAFAHSASCRNTSCSSLCLMFRRVRSHVVSARHSCHVMRIYSLVLKMHVATCVSDNCGLTACPALRASKHIKCSLDENQKGQQDKKCGQQPAAVKRSLDEDQNGHQEEKCVQQSAAKKPNVQGNNVPRVLPMKTSVASLPVLQPFASLVPPISAVTTTTQPLQIMLVTVPPMTGPNVRSISERVGA